MNAWRSASSPVTLPPMLKDELRRPDLELIETHISWVFVGEREVWKVKKPVDLGFLDFSTPAKRRAACDAEVRLNRRLTPDVYLGVVPVTIDPDGRHQFGGAEADAVDWAVHMRRLPDADRADERVRADRLTAHHVESIARHLADFHEGCRCDEETARFGTVEAIRTNVEENFAQTRETIQAHLTPDEAQQIEDWQREFLEEHGDRFRERIATGRIRDGHGDLRLNQMYIDDADDVRILDCIEFNERFRYADVGADVAFLAMDLAWHGRADLAEHFLAHYARESGDYDLYPLIDFYQSYRAFVRGKVSSILSRDATAAAATRAAAAEETRRYYLLALASERGTALPRSVVAVGGIIGTGKSTVASQLAGEMGTAVVDTDRTRKNLLGVKPTQPLRHAPWSGAYTPRMSENVYTEVLRRANAVLESGRPVVLDASFSTRRRRAAARRLAAGHEVPFFFVECRTPDSLVRRRLRARARETGVSDGRLEILDELVSRWEPVEELTSDVHLLLDTSEPIEENIATLRRQVPTWPPGMTG